MRSEAFELWVKLAAGCEKEKGARSPPTKRFRSQGLKPKRTNGIDRLEAYSCSALFEPVAKVPQENRF